MAQREEVEMVVQIEIQYKTSDSESWFTRSLTPEMYFDLEEDELATIDSVPKFNRTTEYLPNLPLTISETRLSVFDPTTSRSQSISEKYWNRGKNRLVERMDFSNGVQKHWEVIIETQVRESPPTWEVIRLGKEDERTKLLFHVWIEEQPDGSEIETVLYGRQHEGDIPNCGTI